MRYWLDTEFIDNGKTIELISIGIVAEDGREYYAQSCEFDIGKINAWLAENVVSHLSPCPSFHADLSPIAQMDIHKKYSLIHTPGMRCSWRNCNEIRREIHAFMDVKKYGNPEIWGWCSAYDWVAFCQLFGTMMDLPVGYPHYMRDIQQVLDERNISDDDLPEQESGLHNALADAKHIQLLWTALEEQKDQRWGKFFKSPHFASILDEAEQQIARGETEEGGFGGE